MKKPALLRAAITAAVPDLERDPDKFLVFVEHGKVKATNTKTCSFEYRYAINLILLDFAGDADKVMLAILLWAQENQPDLLQADADAGTGIVFEVEHMNLTTADVSITLPLTEAVKVSQAEDGTVVMNHLAEPKPEWTFDNLAGE